MKNVKKDILWRVYLVYLLFLTVGFLIIGQVIYIQLFEGEQWRERAKDQTMKYMDIKAIRGDICDSKGQLMATSLPIFEARMDASPKIISDKHFYEKVDSLAFLLSRLFKNYSKEEYKQRLIYARKNNKRYYLIKRNITYREVEQLKTFPLFRLGRYGGGMIIEQKTKRYKPFKYIASRTIGFERQGEYYVGLEGAYSDVLSGVGGKRLMKKISGDSWMPVNDRNEIEPKNGNNIITTIDMDLQDVVENALLKKLMLHDADHGCAVIMEVKTGHVKAIANLKKNINDVYVEEYNYAIGEAMEPGSTFKLASMISVFDHGYVDTDDIVNTGNGRLRFANQLMEDSHHGGWGTITVRKAFEVSSNVGVSKIIYKYYNKNPQKFVDKLYEMNLHQPLGLEIRGEGKPKIKHTKSKTWSKVSLPWMAIGYEVALTPMQILAFYNAIANDGKMVSPMFVKEIRKTGSTIKKFPTRVINNAICKPSTLKTMQELLKGVVERGTAEGIKSNLYNIAGKTGTAQIAEQKYGYGNNAKMQYNASFVGYFPADNPQYSCIVVINKPQKGGYYGSTVAAPVFREIADKVYATQLDIHLKNAHENKLASLPSNVFGEKEELKTILKELNYKYQSENPDAKWAVTDNSKKNIVKLKAKPVKINSKVPNVKGMKAKNAIYILENRGLEVHVTGRGKVVEQSLRAGSTIKSGQEIWLRLSNGA